jgi:CRP-like cAMP-binding protein
MASDLALVEDAARLSLFADLDRSQLEELLPRMREISFDEGEWVVRRGQTDVGLHVIVDGEAGVVLHDEELAVLPKGSFFGEISALLDEETVADVVARAPLRCLFVPAEDVSDFLISAPRVMLRMLETEARRLRTTDELRT